MSGLRRKRLRAQVDVRAGGQWRANGWNARQSCVWPDFAYRAIKHLAPAGLYRKVNRAQKYFSSNKGK